MMPVSERGQKFCLLSLAFIIELQGTKSKQNTTEHHFVGELTWRPVLREVRWEVSAVVRTEARLPFSEVLLKDGRSDLGLRRPPYCHITFHSSVVSYLLKEGNHYLEFDNYQRNALVVI